MSKSQKIALKLLEAISTEDVNAIMAETHDFSEDENWRPYGGQAKNWDRIGGQQSEPVGALAELIINSIDAILMKKAKEHNVDGAGSNDPQSMVEAVRKFYPTITEGNISLLSDQQRKKLAEESVLIGVKRAKESKNYPTYTIADFGEGQNSDRFEKTLLSLGEKNKEGIPFVQGKFNMGSTGSITFCTRADINRGMYKFILSKRNLSDSDGNWGWTLIRSRKVRAGEALPVVEYFCPNGNISVFRQDEILALGHNDIGKMVGGTIVKLYNYDIGPSARAVDFGLYQALTTNLLECALPVRIYDFGAGKVSHKGKLRQEGIADRTFFGMKIAYSNDAEKSDDEKLDLPNYQVIESQEDPDLGVIKIYAAGYKQFPDYLLKHPFRLFYMINGQAQAKERKSFLRKAKLDDLLNHLIVQVDCNSMDATARAMVFKSDRENMRDNKFSRALKDIVIKALSNDSELRDYARKIRERRITDVVQDDEASNKLWNVILKDSPELKELFGIGGKIVNAAIARGNDEYIGEMFPTFLELRRPDNGILQLPVNTYRRIECQTDACNDYFSRSKDAGKFFISFNKPGLLYSMKLRNGKLTITISTPINANVGDSYKATFGIDDSNHVEPFQETVEIYLVNREPVKINKGGDSKGVGEGEGTIRPPNIEGVYKDQWDEYSFDDESGAICRNSGEGFTIYVNMDNKNLHSIKKRTSEDSERKWIDHLFQFGVGVLTFSMYKKFYDKFCDNDQSDWDDYIDSASSAISAQVVNLIQKLGGKQ